MIYLLCLQGWVKAVRKQKDLVFIDLNDGSSPKSLQIVAHSEQFPKYKEFIVIDVKLICLPLTHTELMISI